MPEYPADEWYNIFVLHQNRVTRGQGAKNAIKEDYLPAFLDLVIWGHEHECIPDPTVRPALQEDLLLFITMLFSLACVDQCGVDWQLLLCCV